MEFEHEPYSIWSDDSGNLYINDREEGLVFVRGNIGPGKYDLTVIIEEDNDKYWRLMDTLSPEAPCGFQILDEIASSEWTRLVKDYLRHKRKGVKEFDEWLKEKLYNPLGKLLYEQTWFAESMPSPDASQEDWDDFDRAYGIEMNRREKLHG